MTEKEKMLNGDYYISWDEDLTAERERAKDLLFALNGLQPSLRAEREALVRRLFGRTGAACWVESPFNCDYGYNISVGGSFLYQYELLHFGLRPCNDRESCLDRPERGDLYA